MGFHADAELVLHLSDGFYLNPTLRYRNLKFDADSAKDVPLEDLSDEFRNLNSSGVEAGVRIIWTLN